MLRMVLRSSMQANLGSVSYSDGTGLKHIVGMTRSDEHSHEAEMSRKKAETTSPFLHFSKTQWTVSMRESTVDLPGLPLKEFAGRRL